MSDGLATRSEMQDAYLELACKHGFVAAAHITLTFDRARGTITPERCIFMWRQVVRFLNERVGGKDYRRKWGHSYFGYVMGIEHHKDGVVHAHVVVDNWVDFWLIHELWEKWCGYAWISKLQDPKAGLLYVLKYVTKEDTRPSLWFQTRRRLVDPLTGRVRPADTPAQAAAVKGGSVAARRACP